MKLRSLDTLPGRECGVSLIEVLVTVVVLSIGLLGLAGMQASGTKFNHSAYLRSQATNLAYDMADRMRASRDVALLGAYDTALATTYAGVGPACGALMAAYTPGNDVDQWKHCLETRLPAGRGRVTRLAAGTAYGDGCGQVLPATTEDVIVVEVRWDNARLRTLRGLAADVEPALECFVVRTDV